jgi:hypothetical protein
MAWVRRDSTASGITMEKVSSAFSRNGRRRSTPGAGISKRNTVNTKSDFVALMSLLYTGKEHEGSREKRGGEEVLP